MGIVFFKGIQQRRAVWWLQPGYAAWVRPHFRWVFFSGLLRSWETNQRKWTNATGGTQSFGTQPRSPFGSVYLTTSCVFEKQSVLSHCVNKLRPSSPVWCFQRTICGLFNRQSLSSSPLKRRSIQRCGTLCQNAAPTSDWMSSCVKNEV